MKSVGVWIAVLLCAALGVRAQAAVITGVVRDEANRRLPAIQVELLDTSNNLSRTTTDEDGEYSFNSLTPGAVTVGAGGTGFLASIRNVTVRDGRTQRVDFILAAAVEATRPQIRALVNAAANRPGFLPSSALARGALLVGFGDNVGSDTLVQAESFPLQTTLDGSSAFVRMNGEQFDCFMVYTTSRQFAAVLPSDVPMGTGELIYQRNGQSDPFPIAVTNLQPGVLTWPQDGSRRGVFTLPDFSLVTPVSPAKPGDFVIGWGLGFGASPFDRDRGVFDKRGQYADYQIRVNDVLVPKEKITYIGSAGGFAGGDQFAFEVTEEMARGCANVITITLYDADDPQTPILANPVDLPISPDGLPCGDAHGLPGDAVNVMATTALWLLTTTAGDLTVFDDADTGEFFLANVRGEEFQQSTYYAPTAYNTCGYRWEPASGSTAFSPTPLLLSGAFGLVLPGDPGAGFVLTALSNGGQFAAISGPPAEGQLADGQYIIGTQAFGLNLLAFDATWTGDYSRAPATLKDRFEGELSASYTDDAILTWDEFVEAARRVAESAEFPSDPRVIQRLTYRVDDGPRGIHRINCFVDWQAEPVGDIDGAIKQGVQRYLDSLIPAPQSTEAVWFTSRYFLEDSNVSPRAQPLDYSREVFDAASSFRIYSTEP